MYLQIAFYLLIAFAFHWLYKRFQKWKNTPYGYKKLYAFQAPIHRTRKRQIIQDRYNKNKIPNNIDTIVVGSGPGGLGTAALLSRLGQTVLVLEQHDIAGGCTHAYEDHGYEFDTGVHYVGNIPKYRKLLKEITQEEIEWKRMGTYEDDWTYDVINVNGQNFPLRSGKNKLLLDLINKFPDEQEGIMGFYAEVEKVYREGRWFFMMKFLPEWLVTFLLTTVLLKFYERCQRTTEEVINEYIENEHLKTVILGQFPDVGVPPDRSSFVLHAGVIKHYMDGAWYPIGGTSMIAKNIIPVIEKAGGRVLVGQGVWKVIVDDGLVKGVMMENGDTIEATTVVLATGFRVAQVLCRELEIPVRTGEPSVSHVGLYLGLNGTKEELDLPTSNLWVLPTGNMTEDNSVSKMLENYNEKPLESPMPMFISFPSAKDPIWNSRYKGKSVCVALTEAKKEWFEEYEFQETGHRSKEYVDLKEEFGERILATVEENFPQLIGKIDYYHVSTPLTNQHYIGSVDGESYGYAATAEHIANAPFIRPKTNIDGLYLTGQDVATIGFGGALQGAVITVSEMMGYYQNPLDCVFGKDLMKDLSKVA